jgi:serine/threonine protein kinase
VHRSAALDAGAATLRPVTSPVSEPYRPESRIGATLCGRYALTKVLGSGGMGAVYEATHTTTGKKVAIKLLAPHLSKDLKLVARFRREALAASRLDHENCVHVDDFGEDKDGTFYIAMELVSGRGLGDELRATGPMTPERVARIGVQLFNALDAAHSAGVLHRDLKPQNVMLADKAGRTDIVKVVDFGIAKLTTNDPADVALTVPGTIFGTPEYMSPEQARGEVLDTRSDLYSASVVLWHMLLGRSPFRGTSIRDTLVKVFSEPAPSPLSERPGLTLPPGFEDVLRRGLQKERDARWPDAASYASALAPFADGITVDVPRRAQPGIFADGTAPPTLDKMPAVSRDTLPSVPVSPVAATTPQVQRPRADVNAQTMSMTVPSTAVLSSTAIPPSAPQQPLPVQPRVPVLPALPQQPAPQPAARAAPQAPSPPSPMPAPASPLVARVLTLDGFNRQTVEPPPAAEPAAPRRRRRTPITPAAVIVIVGGTALLAGFVVVAYLAFSGSFDGSSESAPVAPATAPIAEAPTTPPAAPTVRFDGDLPLDPQARDAALGRAERAVAEGRRADARHAYEEAVAADPTAPPALIGLGTLAMQQHDWVVARDAFEKLVSLDRAYRKQFGPMLARARKLAADNAE